MKNYPKVVLLQVSGKFDGYWSYYPPLGLASIASYAKKYLRIPKKNFLILDSNFPFVNALIELFKPDIIGVSSFSNNYEKATKIANQLKKKSPNALFILGGVHISLFPTSLDKVFDFAIIKEGEEIFKQIIAKWPEYIKTKNLSVFFSINSIVYKTENQIHVNKTENLINPLDKIPPIDWSLLPSLFYRYEIIKNYKTNKWNLHKVSPLFTARGCPYRCIFCARSALWERVRFFSEERVVDDIVTLYKEHKITAFHIWDDIFALNVFRLKKIENLLRKRQVLDKIQFFRIFARADLFTEQMVEQLSRLNVNSVAFGFESGSEKILKLLKKNTITLKQNYKAIELCEKNHIGFIACVMLGIFSETKKDMDKTLGFIKFLTTKRTLDAVDAARATPFPGTELYDYAIRKKLLPHNWSKMIKVLSLNDAKNDKPILISNKSLIKYYQKIWRKVKKIEKSVYDLNNQNLQHKLLSIKMNFLNNARKKTFILKLAMDYYKFGNKDFAKKIFWRGIEYILKKIFKIYS